MTKTTQLGCRLRSPPSPSLATRVGQRSKDTGPGMAGYMDKASQSRNSHGKME